MTLRGTKRSQVEKQGPFLGESSIAELKENQYHTKMIRENKLDSQEQQNGLSVKSVGDKKYKSYVF